MAGVWEGGGEHQVWGVVRGQSGGAHHEEVWSAEQAQDDGSCLEIYHVIRGLVSF